MGGAGLPLGADHLLYLATRAGADVLDLPDVGDLSVGRRFDAVWLRPRPGSTLDVTVQHAPDVLDALGSMFALAGAADVAGVWVDGSAVVSPHR